MAQFNIVGWLGGWDLRKFSFVQKLNPNILPRFSSVWLDLYDYYSLVLKSINNVQWQLWTVWSFLHSKIYSQKGKLFIKFNFSIFALIKSRIFIAETKQHSQSSTLVSLQDWKALLMRTFPDDYSQWNVVYGIHNLYSFMKNENQDHIECHVGSQHESRTFE